MPFSPYLADVLAAYQPPNEQGAYALAPPPEPDPASLVSQPPPLASVAPPVVGPMPPPEVAPPPGASIPTDNPAQLVSQPPPSMSVGPTPATPAGVEAGPPPPAPPSPGPDPHAFDLTPTVGGGAPAHEVDLRGPTVTAAQGQRNANVENTIDTVAARNERAAQEEYDMAVSQERAARIREDAYQQSIAEQEEEMQARQDDFDQTARQMARLGQVDPNRFFNSRSTLGKMAAFTELALAGLRGAPSMVMKRIDDDVRAQEFAYYAARDQLGAKQTAFSSAMAKYQNAGAARAMARVAAIDVQSAQLAQIAARNKGNETGNRALEAKAMLDTERMFQLQQGIKFVPATAGGRYFLDPSTGIVYNNKEAQAYWAKKLENAQADRQETAKLGGQILVQHDKAALEAAPDGSVMTKEQRGKLAVEQREKDVAAREFNEQVDALKDHPALNELSPVGPGLAKLGPRIAPKSYKVEQDLNEINTSIINAIGKVAKDAEGKPQKAMLDMYKKRFEIQQGVDTPETARDKLERARNVVNSLARQAGSESSPRPHNYVTPEEMAVLQKTTSLKLHGGK